MQCQSQSHVMKKKKIIQAYIHYIRNSELMAAFNFDKEKEKIALVCVTSYFER